MPCLRHTPRIPSELPRLFWHGEERSLKLSCAENGPVLDEIRRILVHLQNIQTGVVNNVIYDTGLNILQVHQDTTYLVEYWAVFGTG